ncbi:CMGC/DYRK/DYRK2 protein kinase Ppk5 [Schizosaccharomyces cryophilus OY26]|uniref:CMGC/DYRK/DYRK2 protein kinase Ppk5 n=1 Tax=Schizosaccharomyces cryophilus (strain OY26 / ATCC MYA-4695 / CBS 11777 / NBRC 106824 / NRRL Y48691) TaxID=653667 RepID=S9W668_SCHCR|nr:CMGC/DYRK/DYRK2 protein kinase Ppk5 [Schizosaccharomyces cryophilus OY26]EPY54064.1 CMGC/DYRK/DYRK2 protein kinase Ppk5 [Schizosaccharomyces cryophilus OY26]
MEIPNAHTATTNNHRKHPSITLLGLRSDNHSKDSTSHHLSKFAYKNSLSASRPLLQHQYSHNSKILSEVFQNAKLSKNTSVSPTNVNQKETDSSSMLNTNRKQQNNLLVTANADKKATESKSDNALIMEKNTNKVENSKTINSPLCQNRRIVLDKLVQPGLTNKPTGLNEAAVDVAGKEESASSFKSIVKSPLEEKHRENIPSQALGVDKEPKGYAMNEHPILNLPANNNPSTPPSHKNGLGGPRSLNASTGSAASGILETGRFVQPMSNQNSRLQHSPFRVDYHRTNANKDSSTFLGRNNFFSRRAVSPMSEIVGMNDLSSNMDFSDLRSDVCSYERSIPVASKVASYSSASTFRRLPRAPGSKVHTEGPKSPLRPRTNYRPLNHNSRSGPVSFDRVLKDADLVMQSLASRRQHKSVHESKSHRRLLKDLRPYPPKSLKKLSEHERARLTAYELEELKDFSEIYFIGSRSCEKVSKDITPGCTDELAFDDSNGDYKVNVGDHLFYRYEIIDKVGKGSFGEVLRCIDYKCGKLVAIKVIRNRVKCYDQALVEAGILERLTRDESFSESNIIRYFDHFNFRNHLCIVTELLGENLFEVIRDNNYKGFPLIIVKSFAAQLLKALSFLQKQQIIHCDLKPENLLLCDRTNARIKLIDFGSSCRYNEKVYTYLQSRFYRAPEIILGMPYGKEIDIWSFGCILAELYTGIPLFPGANETEQLGYIMEVLGVPPKELITVSTRSKLYFGSQGQAHPIYNNRGRPLIPSSKRLDQLTRCKNLSFLDLISKCLQWDPKKRITIETAIRHEFIIGNITENVLQRTPLNSPINSPIKGASSKLKNPVSHSRVAHPLPNPPLFHNP